jgi:hypothetical protein
MLTITIAAQLIEPVTWRRTKIVQIGGRVQQSQNLLRAAQGLGETLFNRTIIDGLRKLVGERADRTSASMIGTIWRYQSWRQYKVD